MALTRTQQARFTAVEIVEAAKEKDLVVTMALIEEVGQRLRSTESLYAGANITSVRTQVRKLAKEQRIPVALTLREEQLMHRAYMRHMDRDHMFTLHDMNFEANGDDEAFWDAWFITRRASIQAKSSSVPEEMQAWGYREYLRWSEEYAAEVDAWRAENA